MARFIIIANLVLTTSLCFAQSHDKILQANEIQALIPERIGDFHYSADPQSKVIKLGTLQYSMVEKNYTATRQRAIKILLFDYKEAPIMYNQATRKWSTFTTVESDSLILRPAVMEDCIGWESYNLYKKDSQIMLGICNRYFMLIEGKGIELDALKKLVQEFKFEKYPK